MKNHFFQFFLILCFFVMLSFPSEVFEGAKSGLLLWFLTVLPTLFPFLLISRLLLDSCACSLLNKLLAPVISRLFGISAQGSFAFIVGFLCGYPMGAKITADLFHARQISKAEASYLLSFCNNASPSFVITFLVLNTIHQKAFCIPALLLLFGTMILLSYLQRILRHFIKNKDWIFPEMSEVFTQENSIFSKPLTHKMNFSVLESCILNSSETLVKVGGYLMIFSVLLALLELLPIRLPGFLLLKSSLEMTNGILLLSQSLSKPQVLYPLLLALTTFGGWCSVAQTQSMIAGTELKLSSYIIQKLTAALAVSLLTFLYLKFL